MPFIDIDGMRVAYEDAGTGLPIVFIPGLVGTKEWFTCQFSGLRERYRVISYDVRPVRRLGGYALDLLSEDLARFLTALKLQSAVVAGHSFGAMIAQRFAITYRHRTDALVLISAFPRLADAPSRTLVEWMSPGNVQVESGFQAVLRRLFRSKPAASPARAEETDWLSSHALRPSRAALDARIALVHRFNSTQWLGDIEAPTLVIVGAKDRPPFLSGAQLLYEGIPDSALEVIEEGDHFCFYTRHDAVNDAIDEFLTERLARL